MIPVAEKLRAPSFAVEQDTLTEAAKLLETLEAALETIADENSWRGFSPAPQVERMRQFARDRLAEARGEQA